MKRTETVSILKVKPSALKQNISVLWEILGFSKQEQTKQGYKYLGEGGCQKKIN